MSATFRHSTRAVLPGAGRSRDFARGASGATGVPDDLPEMPVGIAEVPGVDAPGTFVRLVGQGCPGLLGPSKQCVDLCSARDEVADAELTRGGRAEREVRVLEQFRPRVKSEGYAALQLEHRRGSRGCRLVALELGADHAR